MATGDLRHEVGDESDGEEANDETGEAAFCAGQDGALAASETVDSLAHDLSGGLDATALKGSGAEIRKNSLSVGPGQRAVTLTP